MPGRDDAPHYVDVHVGQQVRLRRKFLGLSQQALAEDIGLTFQQLQKYERGANRISCSKLYRISVVLKVPVEYFFLGLSDDDPGGFSDSASERAVKGFLATAEGIELAQVFARIKSNKVRRRITELVSSIGNDEATTSDPDGA